METMNLTERVYQLCKLVPEGKVTTYGEIARKLGVKSYRAIGQVLRKNHYSQVPCHRVVCSTGSLGWFKVNKESKEKLNLLVREKGVIADSKVDLQKCLFRF